MDRFRPDLWVLRSMPSLHLAYRLTMRARRVLAEPASPGPAVQVTLAGADLAIHRWLRGPRTGSAFWPRFLADAAEIAVAARRDDRELAPAANLAIPLAAETGARVGPVAVLAPAAQWALAASIRRAGGRRAPVAPFAWTAMSGLAGTTLVRIERRRRLQLEERQRIERAARRERSRVAGEHHVAAGVASVVDELGNLHSYLSLAGGSRARVRKAHLASAARSEATYLGDAALAWGREHNVRNPVLARDVAVSVAGGAETLLTEPQVRQLRAALDALHLTGDVRVNGPSSHNPGRAVTVRVEAGGAAFSVRLAADPAAPVAPLDPTPLPLAMMAPWLSFCTVRGYAEVPVRRAAPGVAAGVGLAAYTYRRTQVDGRPAGRLGLAASVVVGLAHVALATPAVRNPVSIEDHQPHPWVEAVYAPLVLYGIEGHRLSPAERLATAAGIAAIVGLGLACFPHPIDVRRTVIAATADVVAWRAAHGWGRVIDAQAREVAARADATLRADLDAAFRAGQRRILRFAREEVIDLRDHLDTARARLDPEAVEAIAVRLGAVESEIDGHLASTARLPR